MSHLPLLRKSLATISTSLVLSTLPAIPEFKHSLEWLYDNGVFCKAKPVDWNLMHVIAHRMLEHEHLSKRDECERCEDTVIS